MVVVHVQRAVIQQGLFDGVVSRGARLGRNQVNLLHVLAHRFGTRAASFVGIRIVALVDRPVPARQISHGNVRIASVVESPVESMEIDHVVFGKIIGLARQQRRLQGSARGVRPARAVGILVFDGRQLALRPQVERGVEGLGQRLGRSRRNAQVGKIHRSGTPAQGMRRLDVPPGQQIRGSSLELQECGIQRCRPDFLLRRRPPSGNRAQGRYA